MVTRRGDASRRTNDRQDLDDERRARIEAEATSRRLAFVLGASQLLAKSLDLDETLGSLVRLAVPTLADLCIIDLVAPGGSLRRAAVAHADPTVASTARQTMMRYTPDPAGGHPVAEVLRTGHPVLVGDVSSELAEEPPVDSHHLSVVRELGVRSYMVVPLVARGSTIGTVMLESTSEERRFGPGDVALAEDVARSAALAIVRHHEGPVLFRETRAEELASASHAPEGARPYRGPRLRSGVVVPLAGRVHLLGALTMAWAGSERHFDEGDLPMAADLGRRAGLALENARLYEEKRNAAETLQRALLPSEPPAVPGLTTAVRYVAATSGAEVGGDWYEVMTLADGRVGIAVGDAMGHGVEAAAVMGTVRNALRSHAWSGANPAEVVRKLDEFVSGAESAHLATVLYAAYDPSTQVLRWMNAGHPPPLLVGPGPVVQFLDGGHRTMLGLNVGGDDEGKITLPSGATLLLYTDGLIEERASSLDEGLDRLSKAAAAHSDAEPAELLDEILQPLLAHAQLEDDVAVLAARVDPS